VLALLMALAVAPGSAQSPPDAEPVTDTDPAAAPEEGTGDPALDAIYAEVRTVQVPGPARVELGDQGALALADGLVWVPQPAAGKLMNSMGNTVGDDFLGLVFPRSDESWFVVVSFDPAGYIKDDDAKEWDTKELLESLRQGTDEANTWREEQGFDPIEVTGWIEEPRYDETRHHLVWSAGIKDKGVAATPDDGVNYNTYLLGRDGYISMNLVTSAQQVQAQKPLVGRLLDSTTFNEGKRYADFDPETDKVAAYGLAALVGGAAAKKLGLLGVMAAFIVKSWKLIAVGVVAFGAAARKFIGRDRPA
jgi:uncharacterized membrane-anchored protein